MYLVPVRWVPWVLVTPRCSCVSALPCSLPCLCHHKDYYFEFTPRLRVPVSSSCVHFVLCSTRSFFGCFGDRRNNIEYHCYYVVAWWYYIGTDFQWWLCFFFHSGKVITTVVIVVLWPLSSHKPLPFYYLISIYQLKKMSNLWQTSELLLKSFTDRTISSFLRKTEDNVFCTVCGLRNGIQKLFIPACFSVYSIFTIAVSSY